MDTTSPPSLPQCERLAVYAAADGDIVRVPLPAGVVPSGMLSVRGRARLLVTVIDATDPRSDDELVRDAIVDADAQLAELIADGLDLARLAAQQEAA